MNEERRQCPRIACTLPASFADLETAGDVPIPLEHTSTVLDLSQMGLRFTAPEPVAASDRLRLTLEVPGHEPLTVRLFTEWSKPALEHGHFEVGASFLMIGDEEKELLSSYVRQGQTWANAPRRKKPFKPAKP